jgi:ornithine cyclodeaminase
MNIEIVDAEGTRARLPMKDCIQAMAVAMAAVSRKSVTIPSRIVFPLTAGSSDFLAVMPGSVADPPIHGAKLVTLYPGNPVRGRPAIQGFIALFDPRSGAPVALVDGAEITAMRTAAASALATRLLARSAARTLGILGCGVQASSHLEAIALVRDIEEVRVWGRSFDKAKAFAEQHARTFRGRIRPVHSGEEAAATDVVCAVTGAHEPVLRSEWVQPGTHINLVGAHSPTKREADTPLIARSRLFVDSIDSALQESGDILIPLQDGVIDASHIVGEIGCVLLGKVEGRQGEADVTVYKSLGLVAQDLIAAHAVIAAAGEPQSKSDPSALA